ncbi:MAG: hypothetical protein MUE46_06705 [Xanthomonadales bacterium]|jgi:hypothetical protein|nr:hypothetical protein [Xanthomonadales bacterium]
MTESAFIQRLIQALSQPTAPAGAPAMVASYSPRRTVPTPAVPPPTQPAR